jgi:septal ring factor EnvC (AmiA/AmiB activator)
MTKQQLINMLKDRDDTIEAGRFENGRLQSRINELDSDRRRLIDDLNQAHQSCGLYETQRNDVSRELCRVADDLRASEGKRKALQERARIAEIDIWKLLGAMETHGLKHPRLFSRLPIVVTDDPPHTVTDVINSGQKP